MLIHLLFVATVIVKNHMGVWEHYVTANRVVPPTTKATVIASYICITTLKVIVMKYPDLRP